MELPSQYVAASSQIWFRTSGQASHLEITAVPTFAFHSVKGGVGRTTSAVSFAFSVASRYGLRPLLVDADFEAPGITYLFHGDGREAHISLEDLLVLSHADPEPAAAATVSFVAGKLSNQVHDGVTILPCLRNAEMLSAFAVRPEQLQRARADEPFYLLEILRKVAVAAGCDALVIDLRAGFTDLAAMILCGPDVAPIFVTTPSGQAIESTRQMINFIGSEVTRHGGSERRPAIVINNVISQVKRSSDFAAILQSFEESAESFVSEDGGENTVDEMIELTDDDVAGAPVIVLDHSPALTAASRRLSEFVEDLQQQACSDQLASGVAEWVTGHIERIARSANPTFTNGVASKPSQGSASLLVARNSIVPLGERRQKLQLFARDRVFAENSDALQHEFLKVRALRELAERFRTELPNVTCIGMKGAGKTFTFRVLCEQKNWTQFLSSISAKSAISSARDAVIVPVLPAKSLQQSSFIMQMREVASQLVSGGNAISFSQLNAHIDQASQNLNSESDWGEFWLDVIAWSCGVDCGEANAGRQLVEHLTRSGARIIGVLDGLEETFQSFRQDGRQQAAIRGLTTSLAQLITEVPGRPIGQISFVRSDLVTAAYPNNSRQFADRNRAFALTWYERDILELAAWLAYRAGVADSWDEGFQEDASVEARLYPIWGRKLGKADDLAKEGRTREPRSAEWVVAALSDLRGRLTARDLVGFIASSAERSVPDTSSLYHDRLLVPRAMAGAIKPVGTEKINAMAEESPGLKPVINMLRRAPQFSVPLSLGEFQEKVPELDDEKLRMLQENGIILVEANSVEMPEIFRTGLGNVVRAKGGRRSIIGLMNKARQLRSLDTAI